MEWRSKKRYVILGFGVVALTVLALGAYKSQSPKGIEAELGASGVLLPSIGDFRVTKAEARKVSDLSVTNVEAESNGTLLRLELTRGMDAKLAQLYLEEKRVGIESLFVTQPAHYPGIITREVDCPPQFQPEKGALGDMTYYVMYANDRFSYGVCVQDFVTYRSLMGLMYCEDQKMFLEAKLFSPADLFDKTEALKLLGSLSCA
ncbi:MAG: hypothetical protein Q8Q38_01665 [bacterium]|nr:hypothetical protein [bacterium]MDZ4232029.1 hypothetical protein [Candidatus Pacearchaeota archaeon]